MKYLYFKDSTYNFSRWTRKAYAIFKSMGKTINIGILTFDFHKSNFARFFASIKSVFIINPNIELSDINIEFIQLQNENQILNIIS